MALTIRRKSLGGSASDETAVPQTEDDKEAELVEFDRKIYKAQVQMNQAMTTELKGLGIPFFGTPLDLVRSEVEHDSGDHDTPARPKWSRKVTHAELSGLQRRMIDHLEDMYKE